MIDEFANYSLPILDHQTLDIPFEVSGPEDIGTVELGLRLDHTYDEDLQISLIHPDGTTVSLADLADGEAMRVDDPDEGNDDFGEGAKDCSGTLTVFADDADTAIG